MADSYYQIDGDMVMEAEIRFDLSNEEDRRNYTLINQAEKLYFALWDIDNKLREMVKYDSGKYSKEQLDVVEEIRDIIFGILEEYNIDLMEC